MKLVRQVGWGRALLLLAVVWLLLLLLVASPVFRPPSTELNPQTAQRLAQAFSDLEVLKKQHSELRSLFTGINMGRDPSLRQEDKAALYHDLQERLKQAEKLLEQNDLAGTGIESRNEPSVQYEQLRRRISNGVEEFWYFVSGELKKMQKATQNMSPQLATKVTHILEEGVEHRRALLTDIRSLADADGYAAWREKEANELSDLVQRRLQFLQNPPDCSQARKLVCSLNKGCGYGCQLHHAVYCFMVAYGTQRTMILKSRGWRYHKAGWEEVFLPISNTCRDASGSSHSHWPGKTNTQVVDLPIVDSLSPRPPYLPLAVPADLAPRLARLHGDPVVWWVGQLLKYMLRPQESSSALLQDAASRLGFQKPIVGVHIRRTDKVGTEAAFHPIEQYMSAVEEYYNLLEMRQKVPQRRIYLASDDPKVIVETKRKYPQYEILGDPVVAKTAAVATRYSDSSLNGIIIDIHFLALSDYLVCTFSSQMVEKLSHRHSGISVEFDGVLEHVLVGIKFRKVCRVAYEIMQTLYPDAADRFRSLDDIYYYGGQSAHNRVAIIPHHSRSANELDLKVGDLVGVAGNHWDGYSKGKNLRTNQIGLYPSFKVVDKVEAVEFPTYPEVPLKRPISPPES